MRVQLYSISDCKTGRISIMARPQGGDWLVDEVKDWVGLCWWLQACWYLMAFLQSKHLSN